ncbi:MAG: FAD-dependent oxidoreductase [Eubacteriales bacterium]
MTNIKKNIEIELKEIRQETSDVYSFIFNRPENFKWKPGQHGVFKFTDREVNEGKDFRIYSFASINEEDMILFSTRIVDEPSEFKKNLLKLKPGDVMTVDGPMGKFTIKDYSKPSLVMAGGIGITPIRALVKDVHKNNVKVNDIKVLYSDDRGEFAFTDTLKEAGENSEGLEVVFISDRNEFTDKIDAYAKKHKNNSLYYISGTPGMTSFFKEKLRGFGVDKENIVTDTFMGYE